MSSKLKSRSKSKTTTTATIVNNNNNILDNDKIINNKLKSKIILIFDESQKNLITIKKSINELRLLLIGCYGNSNNNLKDQFNSILFIIIDKVLIHFKREPAIERVVKFFTKFLTQIINSTNNNNNNNNNNEEEENNIDNINYLKYDEFFNLILNHIFKRSKSKEKSVRFRSIQIISEILFNLKEDYEFNENTWNELIECITIKSKDRIPAIRKQSIYALSKLQDPSSNDDPISNRLIEMLRFDTSPDVRITTLNYIVPSKKSLQYILEKTLDVNPNVRKGSFIFIGKKIEIRFIPLSLRVGLLKNGLQDRDQSVRESCSTMLIEYWLENSFDILKLIKQLEVELFEQEVELVLLEIFSKGKIGIDKCVEYDLFNLTKEQAINLRVLSQYLKKSNNQDLLDTLLPSIMKFNKVLLYYLRKSEKRQQGLNDDDDDGDDEIDGANDDEMMMKDSNNNNNNNNNNNKIIQKYTYSELIFIQSQLILIAQCLDFSDESGRSQLIQVIQNLLLSISIDDNHIEPLMELLYHLNPTGDKEYSNSIISSLTTLSDSITNENSECARLEMQNSLIQIKKSIDRLSSKKLEIKSNLKQQQKKNQNEHKIIIDKLNSKLSLIRDEMKLKVQQYNEITENYNLKILLEEKIWIKSLYILNHFLKNIKTSLNIQNKSIISNFIKLIIDNCLNSDNSLVKSLAIKILSLQSMVSGSLTISKNCQILLEILDTESLIFFSQQQQQQEDSNNEDIENEEKYDGLLSSIEGLFDILLWYGYSLNKFLNKKNNQQQQQQDDNQQDDKQEVQSDNNNNISFEFILDQLYNLLKKIEKENEIFIGGKDKIQLKLVEGISKIIYNQVCDLDNKKASLEQYHYIFSFLMGMFFNQTNNGKPTQQILSSFFNLLVVSSNKDFDFSIAIIENSFIPSLQNVSKHSITSTTTLIKLYQYLISNLISNNIKQQQQQQEEQQQQQVELEQEYSKKLNIIQDKLYCKLLFNLSLEIISDPISGKNHCKLFQLFKLDKLLVDQESIKQLLFLSDKMSIELNSRPYNAQLKKYTEYLESLVIDEDGGGAINNQLPKEEKERLLSIINHHKKPIRTSTRILSRLNSTKRVKSKKVRYSTSSEEEEQQEEEESSSSEEEEEEEEISSSEEESDSKNNKRKLKQSKNVRKVKQEEKELVDNNNNQQQQQVITIDSDDDPVNTSIKCLNLSDEEEEEEEEFELEEEDGDQEITTVKRELEDDSKNVVLISESGEEEEEEDSEYEEEDDDDVSYYCEISSSEE